MAAAVAAMIVTSSRYTPPPSQEPPKVTDWMQGWGNIVGVAAGILAALFTGLLLLHERRQAKVAQVDAAEARRDAKRERAEAAADRARVEADRVEALKLPARAVVHGSKVSISGQPSLGLIAQINVSVFNFGSGPVRRLEVSITSREGDETIDLDPIDVFGPGHEVARRSFSPHQRESPFIVKAHDIRLRFIDVNGRSWVRVNNGEPELG